MHLNWRTFFVLFTLIPIITEENLKTRDLMKPVEDGHVRKTFHAIFSLSKIHIEMDLELLQIYKQFTQTINLIWNL